MQAILENDPNANVASFWRNLHQQINVLSILQIVCDHPETFGFNLVIRCRSSNELIFVCNRMYGDQHPEPLPIPPGSISFEIHEQQEFTDPRIAAAMIADLVRGVDSDGIISIRLEIAFDERQQHVAIKMFPHRRSEVKDRGCSDDPAVIEILELFGFLH